jgi:hypothetical protein
MALPRRISKGLRPSRAQAENVAQIVAFWVPAQNEQTILLVFRLRFYPRVRHVAGVQQQLHP